MSTDTRRGRSRRRRGRGFLLAFAGVLAGLAVVAAVGAAATVVQGPRLTEAQVDPVAAASASGARVILTTTQSLKDVDAAQVEVEPAAPFSVDTSGRNVGVRFTLPLRDDTDYTVRVRDVQGVGGGPAATLEESFRTPPLSVYTLERGGPDGDTIVRSALDGSAGEVVFTHPHIEDFRATAAHLVVSVRGDDDTAALLVTDLDGANARELPLPGEGNISNLQSADRGERIGYTFSDADLGESGGIESALYTTSLADAAATAAPTEVTLAGGDARVAEWRFVPDTDSILVLTFDSRLLLAASDGSDPAPLGSALAIDGIARGSSLAIVERFDSRAVIDLTDGSETPLAAASGDIGSVGDVVPLPGDAGTLRTAAELGDGSRLLSTDVVRVDADGTATTLVVVDAADGVLQTCVSPSGRYAAVLVSPESVRNPYDGYLLPLPERLQTRIVEIDTGNAVTTLPGSDVSWCQVPPS